MYLEIRSLFTGVITLFAVERLFRRARSHVPLELLSSIGGVLALCALERLISTVNQHVLLQMASVDTRVPTVIAVLPVCCDMCCLRSPLASNIIAQWGHKYSVCIAEGGQ